jgi:hypothetical protein
LGILKEAAKMLVEEELENHVKEVELNQALEEY